jgi:Dienelactone hydrolase family
VARRAALNLPAGAAPSGAVVVLHGCDGVEPHYRHWPQRLADWGYAALLIDSFGPRGFQEVCSRGLLVAPEAQARDAFDGAAYLRAAPRVRAQRVGERTAVLEVIKRQPKQIILTALARMANKAHSRSSPVLCDGQHHCDVRSAGLHQPRHLAGARDQVCRINRRIGRRYFASQGAR